MASFLSPISQYQTPQHNACSVSLPFPGSSFSHVPHSLDFPGGSDGKVSARNAGDLGSISGSGRSPGEGNGNPLQYSCLKNPMDRGAWWATVPRVPEESETT